jgi:hypothetical protein
MASARPPRGSPTSRFSERRHRSISELGDLPQAYAPLQSLTREPYAPLRCESSLEVSCPLSATQSSRATIPGRCLSRVTLRPRAYHAPRRVAPSTISLVSFQPGALTGLRPSKHDLAEIALVSRREPPLLRFVMPESGALFNAVAGAVSFHSTRRSLQGSSPLPVGATAIGY